MELVWRGISGPAGSSDGSWLHRYRTRSGGGIPTWHIAGCRRSTRASSVPAAHHDSTADSSADTAAAAEGTRHPDTTMATQRAEFASHTPSTAAVAPARSVRFPIALAGCLHRAHQRHSLVRLLTRRASDVLRDRRLPLESP